MAEQEWSLRGEYMESCNCDYLCPCIYTNPQGPATNEHCIAVMVFRIDDGRSGALRLDGLKFALVIRSGRVMADGNWIFGVVVDEAADPAAAPGARGDRKRRGRRADGDDPAEPGLRFPRRRIPADRDRDRRPHRRATIPELLSFEVEGVLSRNRSGEPYLPRQYRPSGRPPAGAGPRRRRPGCMLSASISTSRTAAITAISRRSPGPPEPHRDAGAPLRVAVIGGGIGGLSAALALRQAGFRGRCLRAGAGADRSRRRHQHGPERDPHPAAPRPRRGARPRGRAAAVDASAPLAGRPHPCSGRRSTRAARSCTARRT